MGSKSKQPFTKTFKQPAKPPNHAYANGLIRQTPTAAMTDDNKHSNKPSSGSASPNDEHLLINQKQIRNALRKIADFSEKDNADALANQQMLLNNQRQVLETAHAQRS